LNFGKHTIDIRQHVIVPEAQDAITIGFKPPCALQIGHYILHVLSTIDLNDQPGAMTGEIDDVWTNPDLSPEMSLDERQAMAQMRPKLFFCISRHLAHLPGMRALRRGDRTIPSCPCARFFARHRNHSNSLDPHP